ncbi:fimbria biosynthesis transcriptional regulator FimZ [Enterobacter hormaechei subsp. steigerwaltii]|nr:fimbria biosynthesis transcriptional regulator FimZ [Enterobacter hormaechei subsp. steigerwaltii]
MKPASVIIMDEHPIVRMSIEVLLQKNKNIQVKLKSGDSHEVLDCIRNHPIDLVILDIEMTGTDGFVLLKRIRNLNKDIKVLFLSSKSEAFYAGRAIRRAGANGFVSKRKDLGEIYNAVEMILTGYSFFPSETLSFINHLGSRTGAAVDMPLSNREVTVLRYLANGLSNKEIADQLLLSNKTISAHKSNIFSKLGVQSIVELIDYAKAHELL